MPEYNITKWSVHPLSVNKNVILGVRKNNLEIIIVIRPTDGDKVSFSLGIERKALLDDNSELWGKMGLLLSK